MDAKQLVDEISGRTTDKARELYHRAEEQLPEGSMKYALLGLAGLTIGAVSYQLGKSRMRRLRLREPAQRVSKMVEQARESIDEGLSSAKEATKSTAQSVNKIDFTPIYKLAKLWLVYKISL